APVKAGAAQSPATKTLVPLVSWEALDFVQRSLADQHLMCGAECIEPGRDAAIGCRMQQGSFDLLDSNAAVEGAFYVQLDLRRPVQGSEHRQVHQAAGLSVERSIPPRP